MSAVVRIQHLDQGPVDVRRIRTDVPSCEPHTLLSSDRLGSGQAITLSLHAGEIVVIADAEVQRHG